MRQKFAYMGIVASVVLMCTGAYAQGGCENGCRGMGACFDSPNHHGAGTTESVARRVDMMTKRLDLSTTQSAEVKRLLEAKQARRQALTAELKALEKSSEASVEKVLSTDQKAKYKKMHSRKSKGGKNAPGAKGAMGAPFYPGAQACFGGGADFPMMNRGNRYAKRGVGMQAQHHQCCGSCKDKEMSPEKGMVPPPMPSAPGFEPKGGGVFSEGPMSLGGKDDNSAAPEMMMDAGRPEAPDFSGDVAPMSPDDDLFGAGSGPEMRP